MVLCYAAHFTATHAVLATQKCLAAAKRLNPTIKKSNTVGHFSLFSKTIHVHINTKVLITSCPSTRRFEVKVRSLHSWYFSVSSTRLGSGICWEAILR